MKEGRQNAMRKTCWTSRAQRTALIVMIAAALLAVSMAMQAMTAHAAGATLSARVSCSSSTARRLDARLWHEPVSGEQLTVTLYGYYHGSHFCGVLSAEAALTLPAGYEAEWICLTLHDGGEDACGAGYEAKWTCLTLQAGGTGACGDLGPGPATGQHTFVLSGPDQLQSCAGVDVRLQGFFTAEFSITRICG